MSVIIPVKMQHLVVPTASHISGIFMGDSETSLKSNLDAGFGNMQQLPGAIKSIFRQRNMCRSKESVRCMYGRA